MDMRRFYLDTYAGNEAVRQLILTEYHGGSRGVLELWSKDEKDAWVMSLSCAALLGRAGVGRAAENDSKTPLGDFGLLCAFGLCPDPGTALPYIPVDEYTYCCGDREHYNRIIDLRRHPHDCRGERLADFDPEYRYGLFFDYNSEGIPGKGFAIFLHCRGAKPYTGGCIAVAEPDMIHILRHVDIKARLCVF